MTTGSNSDRSATGATLSASFTGATGTIYETGFYYGTSSDNLTEKITNDGTNDSEGEFSVRLTSLQPNTQYYYKAYVLEYDAISLSYVERPAGNVLSFTTLVQTLMAYKTGWLELPALRGDEDYFGYFYGSGGNTDDNRNYSYNYSYVWYASLWTAYQLKYEHKSGSASTDDWAYNPNIASAYQITMTGSSYPTMYGADNYSKGHQCPNADRKSNQQMNTQTYYCTNQTPQIQNGFNGSIWSALEDAERSLVSSQGEIVYVVTGPAYQKIGGHEEITYFQAVSGKNASPARVPVPNYYWKAFLKVNWNGNSVQSAKAIGFWFEHKQYSDNNFAPYAVSVNQIETWTGFDLFANLPNEIEEAAEANTSWSDFTSKSNISSVSDKNWGTL